MSSKLLKIFSVSMLSLVLVTGCGCQKKSKKEENKNEEENKPVLVDNENLTQSGLVDGFQCDFSGPVYDGSMTTMAFKVTNTTDQPQFINEIIATVTYMDGEYERVSNITVTIANTLQPSQSEVVSTAIDADLTNTKSVQYSIIK